MKEGEQLGYLTDIKTVLASQPGGKPNKEEAVIINEYVEKISAFNLSEIKQERTEVQKSTEFSRGTRIGSAQNVLLNAAAGSLNGDISRAGFGTIGAYSDRGDVDGYVSEFNEIALREANSLVANTPGSPLTEGLARGIQAVVADQKLHDASQEKGEAQAIEASQAFQDKHFEKRDAAHRARIEQQIISNRKFGQHIG